MSCIQSLLQRIRGSIRVTGPVVESAESVFDQNARDVIDAVISNQYMFEEGIPTTHQEQVTNTQNNSERDALIERFKYLVSSGYLNPIEGMYTTNCPKYITGTKTVRFGNMQNPFNIDTFSDAEVNHALAKIDQMLDHHRQITTFLQGPHDHLIKPPLQPSKLLFQFIVSEKKKISKLIKNERATGYQQETSNECMLRKKKDKQNGTTSFDTIATLLGFFHLPKRPTAPSGRGGRRNKRSIDPQPALVRPGITNGFNESFLINGDRIHPLTRYSTAVTGHHEVGDFSTGNRNGIGNPFQLIISQNTRPMIFIVRFLAIDINNHYPDIFLKRQWFQSNTKENNNLIEIVQSIKHIETHLVNGTLQTRIDTRKRLMKLQEEELESMDFSSRLHRSVPDFSKNNLFELPNNSQSLTAVQKRVNASWNSSDGFEIQLQAKIIDKQDVLNQVAELNDLEREIVNHSLTKFDTTLNWRIATTNKGNPIDKLTDARNKLQLQEMLQENHRRARTQQKKDNATAENTNTHKTNWNSVGGTYNSTEYKNCVAALDEGKYGQNYSLQRRFVDLAEVYIDPAQTPHFKDGWNGEHVSKTILGQARRLAKERRDRDSSLPLWWKKRLHDVKFDTILEGDMNLNHETNGTFDRKNLVTLNQHNLLQWRWQDMIRDLDDAVRRSEIPKLGAIGEGRMAFGASGLQPSNIEAFDLTTLHSDKIKYKNASNYGIVNRQLLRIKMSERIAHGWGNSLQLMLSHSRKVTRFKPTARSDMGQQILSVGSRIRVLVSINQPIISSVL